MVKILRNIYFSFPFQLLVLHIRSNHILLGLWILIALLISGQLGYSLGFQYLFLDPEYMGNVNFWSFYFIGLAFGGFYMTWHLTTYLLNSYRFPFLASLGRPFTKFCFNNSVLPIAFLIFYIIQIAQFQYYQEYWTGLNIFWNCFGLVLGLLSLVAGYSIYFRFTNKDISSYEKAGIVPPHLTRSIAPGHRGIDIEAMRDNKKTWRVDTYLTETFRPRLVRSVAHYDSRLLKNILRQNHLNALIVQLGSLLLLVILGALVEYPAFRIPASASIFILASVLVAITGAITYWFHGWRVTIFIILLIVINFLTRYDLLSHKNKAYGLSYENRVSYSYEKLHSICKTDLVKNDKQNTIQILNNWKLKNKKEKPKIVLFTASGGGLKAAMWSLHVMQQLNQMAEGKLMEQTALITGASGGMLGTAYMRELYLQEQKGTITNCHDEQYLEDIGKDLLNALAFTLVSNDIFVPWMQFEKKDYVYYKDRAYIFEKQLNENTHSLLNKPVSAYRIPEQEAIIPMLYITPSIINDARRLIISPQGVSYMMIAPIGLEKHDAIEVDAVDFGWLFKNHRADSLGFLTALRMNASYPYVLPNVFLPSNPSLEVLDAGFRDNYGLLSATRFIQVFKDWIKENTSGVVIVQISSIDKFKPIEPNEDQGAVESIFNPLGIASKIISTQEYEHDNSLGFIFDLLGKDNFDIIRFIYRPTNEERKAATVSFHITQREKQDIINSFYSPDNQAKAAQLMQLIKE